MYLPKNLWETCHCHFCGLFCCTIFLESVCTHGKPVTAFFVGFSVVQFFWSQFVPMGNLSLPFCGLFCCAIFCQKTCGKPVTAFFVRIFVVHFFEALFAHGRNETLLNSLNKKDWGEMRSTYVLARRRGVDHNASTSANKIMLICTSSIKNYKALPTRLNVGHTLRSNDYCCFIFYVTKIPHPNKSLLSSCAPHIFYKLYS